jgi:hypothetical protein
MVRTARVAPSIVEDVTLRCSISTSSLVTFSFPASLQDLNLWNLCSETICGVGVGAKDGPTMLIPAYDPVAIAVLGFGIVLAAGLAFAF